MPQVFEQSLFLFFPLTKSGLLPVWSDFAHGIEEEEEEEKEEAEFMNSKAGKRLPARSCKLHSRYYFKGIYLRVSACLDYVRMNCIPHLFYGWRKEGRALPLPKKQEQILFAKGRIIKQTRRLGSK